MSQKKFSCLPEGGYSRLNTKNLFLQLEGNVLNNLKFMTRDRPNI